MDATTMPSITLLLPKLVADYPTISFQPSSDFYWSPTDATVYFDPQQDTRIELLLHELSHGLLEHHDYSRDIELISMERQAWDKAKEIAPLYGVDIESDTIDDHLDTYRDWLHARSTCPHCTAVGHQIKKNIYRCSVCGQEWRVNEARVCGLKRYKTKKHL